MVNRSEKSRKKNDIKKLLPCLLAAALLIMSVPKIPAMAAAAADGVVTYRAVLIGNSYTGTEDELEGTKYGIKSMEDMLKTLKNPYSEVLTVHDGTKKDMQRAVARVFSKADADDLTLFYYSGHGAVAEEDSYTSEDYYDGALYFWNRKKAEGEYYATAELKELFDRYNGKKALIIDSCGSGAFVQTQAVSGPESTDEGTHLIRTDAEAHGFLESMAEAFSEGSYVPEDEMLPIALSGEFRDSDYYLLCAANKGEYSYQVPVLIDGEYYYGALMTIGLLEGTGYEFMKGWTESMPADTDMDERITLKEIYAYIPKVVKERLTKIFGYEQNSVCYPSNSRQVLFDNQEKEQIKPAPVFRLYNPNTADHFMTMNDNERYSLIFAGWSDEGAKFFCYPKGTEENAVYRLYNRSNGEHFYTLNAPERDGLLKAGWSYEGIAWYSSDGKDKAPVYRLYNPNLGHHLFTTDIGEFTYLLISGWEYEGIAFFSSRDGNSQIR